MRINCDLSMNVVECLVKLRHFQVISFNVEYSVPD